MDFHMSFVNGKLERINCHCGNFDDRDPIVVRDLENERSCFTIDIGKQLEADLIVFLDKEQAGDLAWQLEKAMGWPEHKPIRPKSLVDKPENPPAESAEATQPTAAAASHGPRFTPTKEEAFHLHSETGDPIWHCREWDLWWCSPISALPDRPTPGAVRCDWVQAAPENPPAESAEALARETDGEVDPSTFIDLANSAPEQLVFSTQHAKSKGAPNDV